MQDEHCREHTEDRYEQRERRGARRPDQSHAFIERDEGEHGADDSEVGDRSDRLHRRVEERAPTAVEERDGAEQHCSGRGCVDVRRYRPKACDGPSPGERVRRPGERRTDEQQVADYSSCAEVGRWSRDDHQPRQRDRQPDTRAPARPLAECRPGGERRQDRNEAGDENRAIACRRVADAVEEEEVVREDDCESEDEHERQVGARRPTDARP